MEEENEREGGMGIQGDQGKKLNFEVCRTSRGGNRSGQALKGLSLAYDESLRSEPGLQPIKGFYFGLAWPNSLFKSLLHNKYLIFYGV